jgi:hypothetical protein
MIRHEFFYYLIASFVLRMIPVLGKYVAVINTFLHEVGHALMAYLLGGRVQSISLFANTEGLAVTAHSSRISRNLTSIAGYPFASFCGFVMVWALKNGYENDILLGWCSLLIIAFFLWIRNAYGFFWAVSFGAITYYVIFKNPALKEPFVYFMAATVVVQSLLSALVILYLSITQPEDSGDAGHLARYTALIPAFIWGLVFAGQAVYFSFCEIQLLVN